MSSEPNVVRAATPGMAWGDIAKSAYRAYAASMGNKNFRGEPMPVFSDLPQAIQVAWEAAVRQAGFCLSLNQSELEEALDESRWAGWVPPHLQTRDT